MHSNGQMLLYLRGLQYCETFITESNDISTAQGTMQNLIPCPGLPSKETSQATTTSTKYHLQFSHSNNSYTLRSNKCKGATTLKDEPCSSCQSISTNFQQTTADFHPKTPLHKVARGRIERALKIQRQKTASLEREIKSIKQKIKDQTIPLQPKLHDSCLKVLDNEDLKDPFIKLFWQEQRKNLQKDPKARRWHPMMIRLAILLHSQSPQAYRTLRDTGTITLPGETTLRDYTNYICPQQGFKPEVYNVVTIANALDLIV